MTDSMDLILWRHAEAADAAPGMDDLSRVLTGRGERQAREMAHWLDKHLPASTRVLSSPAVRTRQTAQDLRRKVELSDALAPKQGVAALLGAVGWATASTPVMVVGHQPTLGLALAHLVGGVPLAQLDRTTPWRLRKGAFWWLRCERDTQDRPGVIVLTVRSPDSP
ncbi:histidine phosphatase family protein [Mitsuaria sp. GD03876]|uniref:SixA phosphatase family protein n=1 Tax=Mitsuaria sp. GD03876 TaxID=2975399 RepID=UPI00244B6647|nr:histidine phosphatase family protein [Mitsuaria sp. GD03876]MDH0867276.1 histidine phosphatase family protein [Mitsuaria sp. GD03876]